MAVVIALGARSVSEGAGRRQVVVEAAVIAGPTFRCTFNQPFLEFMYDAILGVIVRR